MHESLSCSKFEDIDKKIVGTSTESIEGAILDAFNQKPEESWSLKWFKLWQLSAIREIDKSIKYMVILKWCTDFDEQWQAVVESKVAEKQEISPGSPMQKQQQDFIFEGGNSQPLK